MERWKSRSIQENKMSDCQFYNVEVKRIRCNDEISNDGQAAPSKKIDMPWCSHKYSPVSKTIATNSLGGGNLLTCEGSLDNCAISAPASA
jgi:hypothetical protein